MNFEGNRRQEKNKPFEGLKGIVTEPRPPRSNWPPLEFEKPLPPEHESLGQAEISLGRLQGLTLMLRKRDSEMPPETQYIFSRNNGLDGTEDGSYTLTIFEGDIENTTKRVINFTAEQAQQLRIKKGEKLFYGYEDKAQKIRRDSGDEVVMSGVLHHVLPDSRPPRQYQDTEIFTD